MKSTLRLTVGLDPPGPIHFSSEGLDFVVAGLPGETHWVFVSTSELPSVVPGLVQLAIGNCFTDLDPVSVHAIGPAGWDALHLAIPPVFGVFHFQSVTLDQGRPIPVSNAQGVFLFP